MDEEGRYYYQQAGDNQNLVSIPAEVAQENEGVIHIITSKDIIKLQSQFT